MKLFLLSSGLALSAIALLVEEPPEPLPRQQAFDLARLADDLRASGKAWHPFLERESLEAGVYRLPAGAEDRQAPHELDEVYFVSAGRARLRAGDEVFEARPGSVFFVEREVEHRFTDIEEDLVVLVFFSKHAPED